jgi:hypothetical protein
LKEQIDIQNIDDSKLSADEKKAYSDRLAKIFDRLSHIQAEKAESKAIKILVGLGFS